MMMEIIIIITMMEIIIIITNTDMKRLKEKKL